MRFREGEGPVECVPNKLNLQMILDSSCCEGQHCPHKNGVCCSGGSHCCASGHVCVQGDPGTPPACLNLLPLVPKHVLKAYYLKRLNATTGELRPDDADNRRMWQERIKGENGKPRYEVAHENNKKSVHSQYRITTTTRHHQGIVGDVKLQPASDSESSAADDVPETTSKDRLHPKLAAVDPRSRDSVAAAQGEGEFHGSIGRCGKQQEDDKLPLPKKKDCDESLLLPTDPKKKKQESSEESSEESSGEGSEESSGQAPGGEPTAEGSEDADEDSESANEFVKALQDSMEKEDQAKAEEAAEEEEESSDEDEDRGPLGRQKEEEEEEELPSVVGVPHGFLKKHKGHKKAKQELDEDGLPKVGLRLVPEGDKTGPQAVSSRDFNVRANVKEAYNFRELRDDEPSTTTTADVGEPGLPIPV